MKLGHQARATWRKSKTRQSIFGFASAARSESLNVICRCACKLCFSSACYYTINHQYNIRARSAPLPWFYISLWTSQYPDSILLFVKLVALIHPDLLPHRPSCFSFVLGRLCPQSPLTHWPIKIQNVLAHQWWDSKWTIIRIRNIEKHLLIVLRIFGRVAHWYDVTEAV
jgi:hypothetical protein